MSPEQKEALGFADLFSILSGPQGGGETLEPSFFSIEDFIVLRTFWN